MRLSALAAALADAAHNRATATVLGSLPSGWRNLASGYQVKTYVDDGGDEHRVEYRFSRTGLGLPADEAVHLVSASADEVVLADDNGVARRFAVARHGQDVYVDSAQGPVHLVAYRASPSRVRRWRRARWLRPCPAT